MTVDALWILEATDVAANQQNAQFFCGIANGPAHSTFNFSSLPPSRYAVAFVHATGIGAPQQIALVLKDVGGAWKIAGFSFRPLTLAGHDALWHWSQARDYAKKKQLWNAYFYYATAAYLATRRLISRPGTSRNLCRSRRQVRRLTCRARAIP